MAIEWKWSSDKAEPFNVARVAGITLKARINNRLHWEAEARHGDQVIAASGPFLRFSDARAWAEETAREEWLDRAIWSVWNMTAGCWMYTEADSLFRFESALQEAQRLSRNSPGFVFEVRRCIFPCAEPGCTSTRDVRAPTKTPSDRCPKHRTVVDVISAFEKRAGAAKVPKSSADAPEQMLAVTQERLADLLFETDEALNAHLLTVVDVYSERPYSVNLLARARAIALEELAKRAPGDERPLGIEAAAMQRSRDRAKEIFLIAAGKAGK